MELSTISTRAPKSFDKEKTKHQLTILADEISELQNILYNLGLVNISGKMPKSFENFINLFYVNINITNQNP